MLERSERLLRILCAALAILLVSQWARVILRRSPLANVVIPAIPSLGAATNAPTEAKPASTTAGALPGKPETNTTPRSGPLAAETNTKATNTNTLVHSESRSTNAVPALAAGIHTNASAKTNTTNLSSVAPGPHPRAKPPLIGGGPVAGPFAGMPGGPGQGGAPPLPPEVQARIDRITDSEILAPANKPLPMALLGIAGTDVFLRTATGQTGLVKPGEDLGGVKILKVGINRVLVEEQGEKKELTIFEGLGGESLMPKQPDNSK